MDIPLQVVTGDLSAAAFVHGTPRRDVAYITVGTGAFVQRLLPHPLDGEQRLLNGVVYQTDDTHWYSLEGTVNGAGSALNWLSERHGLEAHQLQSSLAEWCAGEEADMLFLNGVSGLGSPRWVADFESRFVGDGDLKQQAIAVVESIAFLLCDNLRAMAEVISAPESIVIGGGLSQVDGFCQRLADLSGLKVMRSGETEATAKGLAYLLAGLPSAWRVQYAGSFTPRAGASIGRRYDEWSRQMQLALAAQQR
jgi:glycerol kinase